MARQRLWTENEILSAIELYLLTPFGKIHSKNPEIIRLGAALNRTPSAIALKLANLASIDDSIPQSGMANASALDRQMCYTFFQRLADSARNLSNDISLEPNLSGFAARAQTEYSPPETGGTNTTRFQSVRQGQSYFRKIVLASYDNKCAMTGIEQQELLVAGHIRKWSEDVGNRMNPQNGICLNRLQDRAFEANLLAIEDDGKILYSRKLTDTTREKMKRMCETGYLTFPKRFRPNIEFLSEHRAAFLE